MKGVFILVFTAFCCAVSINYAYSQAYLFDVQTLNLEQGLPHRNTKRIVQDHNGYIWISGQGNISRYDGSEWKVYNYSQLNIFQDNSTFLALDKHNRLWYAEPRFDQYSGAIDTNTGDTLSLQTLSNGIIHSDSVIYVSNSRIDKEKILIATESGKIYTYKDDFELIYTPSSPIFDDPLIAVAEGFDEDYFVYILDAETLKSQLFRIKNKRLQKQYILQDEFVELVRTLPQGIIETSHYNDGYSYYQVQNDSLIPYHIIPEKDKYCRIIHLTDDYICYFLEGKKIIIRDKAGELLLEKNIQGVPRGRMSVFVDKQNIIWMATGNGIAKILPQKSPFEIINKSTVYKGNSIRGIYQDENYLWWGGYNENLRRNLHTGETENFLPNHNTTVPLNFLKDDRGRVWMGSTHSIYFEYLIKQDTFIAYEIPDFYPILFQNHITKNHWLGTHNGWYIGDLGGQITHVPLPNGLKNVYVRQFYQNEEGIWIASGNGLFLIDGQSEKLIKYYTTDDGLPSNNLNYIHQDAAGIYWIATKDAGLMRWDKKNNKFKRFTEGDYLTDNNIYCIYEDESNRLWLPSDKGLMCFDKTTYNTQVFLEKDGIAHKEFNTYSYFKAEDGTFFFGGIEGITKFHPKDIPLAKNKYKVPLYITDVQILDEDDNEYRDETTSYLNAQSITFSPQDKILELQPGLLDYKNTGDKQYAYRLNDQQWIYTNSNKISIMNPSFGQYTLSIKGKAASGEWSETLKIPFYVNAPFYRQIWFFVMAGLSAAGLIFLFFRRRLRRAQKDKIRLESEVKKRTAQIERDKTTIEKQATELRQLDQTKSRFFSNITHEFRTPLTLVTGPVEKMLSENPPENIRQPLRGVLKNARSLLGLINQLLDISKLESAQMQVEISHGDIIRYTQSLVYQFEPLAATKQINLTFETEKEVWETYFDKDKWAKIVSNLVSNAIKFTPENGRVCIYLKNIQKNKKDNIQLIVKDTGQGISPEYLPKIFDRFYRSSDHSHTVGGTGIGLALVKELIDLQNGTISVESSLDTGTEFVLMLPVAPASKVMHTSIGSPSLIEVDLADYEQNGSTETLSDDKNKLQLLIIEDNAEMRSFIRSCIDQNIYNIAEAADGEEGIKKALDLVPDLIISDVMMPKMDGFAVVQAIRNNLATSHIPVILLTAKASLESRMEGFGRGADAFMSKPFSPDELILRVHKLIEIRMMLQSRYQNNVAPSVLQGFQKEDEFINDVKAYIIENISEPNLTGEVISRQFGMSRMQLHRKLKALIKYTPAEYVRSIRLKTAMQLLQTTNLNISEIAYQTGFSSPAHFSRGFKKMYGKTPSEFSKS